jgi:Flp pilus assembly protein TadD
MNRPPTASTLYRLGKLLVAQERAAEAESAFLSCVSRYPDYVPAYAALADLYVRHHRLDRAESVLRNGLEVAPSDAVLLNDLGMCYLMDNNVVEALDQFTSAVAHQPDDPRIRANRALAMGLLGRDDEALHQYERNGDRGVAHFNVALICEARGDHERAAEEFARARALGVKDQ